MNTSKRSGIRLSLAQIRFAYKELYGHEFPDSESYVSAGNRMYAEKGEVAICKVLEKFDAYGYVHPPE